MHMADLRVQSVQPCRLRQAGLCAAFVISCHPGMASTGSSPQKRTLHNFGAIPVILEGVGQVVAA